MPHPTPPNATTHASRRIRLALALLLVGMTLAAYVPALRAGFVFDDGTYVTENDTLRTLAGLGHIWLTPWASPQYYPLTFTSFWFEYHLWRLAPLGYHAVNILLHALNAVLLWNILRRLRIPGAWIAAAIFALHPIQVESVAWVTERKNVLSGAFGLAALLIFLRRDGLEGRIAWRPYLATLLLYLAALLTKSVTLALPVVILVLAWWKHGRIERRLVWLLSPLLLIGLVLATVTVLLERYHAGSGGAPSILERGLVMGRAFWFYPRLLLWPHPLMVIYPRWTIDAQHWWPYLFPAAAVATGAALFVARRRIGTGPFVAILTYGILFTPTSGVVNIAFMRFSFVADHFAYLPSIPLIALAVAGGVTARQRLDPRAQWPTYAIGATLLMALALLTAWQCTIYRDSRTLWTDTLAKNPDSWMAHNNLGAILMQEGAANAALGQLTEALRLKPDFTEAHNNLGSALQALGRLEEARAQYEEALRLQPANAEAHNNLGTILQGEGHLDEAMAQYLAALRVQPNHAKARTNVASLWQAKGDIEQAIVQYEQVLQFTPDCAEAHNNLGTALAAQGKHTAAIAEYGDALRLKPAYPEAHYNLGIALASQGQTEHAIAEFREALRLRPEYAEAHNNLGKALAAQGRTQEAMAHYTHALRVRPESPETHNNLGNALHLLGRDDEAIAHYQEALRLRAVYPEARNNLGAALAAQGKSEEAITQYTQALREKPDYADAHYNWATLLLAERRFDEAKSHFTAAIELRPQFAAAHNNLGYLLFEQGHTRDAIAEYEQALRIDADSPEAHTNLAAALAVAGKPTDAIAQYGAALQLQPDHAAAHRGLGLLLAHAGQRDRALVELEAAVRLDPGDTESQRQLELLRTDHR